MGLDLSGCALSSDNHFSPLYLDGGAVTARVPFDLSGRRVFIPMTDVTFFSFDDGALTGTLTIDAIHGHALTCESSGGLGVVFTNTVADPGGTWDTLTPPDASPLAAIVAFGLAVAPNAGDPDVSGQNIAYQVY